MNVDYEYAALDFSDDSEAARERRTAWLEAVQLGFHQGRSPEEQVELWLRHVEIDGLECRGFWLPSGAFGAGPGDSAEIDRYFALLIRNQSGDDPEQGCFAASARPDDRDEFVIPDFEIYVAQGEHGRIAIIEGAEFFAQSFDANHSCFGFSAA